MSIASIPDRLLPAALAALWFATAPAGAETPADQPPVQALQKQCDAKDWAACERLAFRYLNGDGVARDFDRGAAILAKACEARFADACVSLGAQYDAPKDSAKAISWYSRACALDDPLGCELVANLYEEGKVVPRNVPRAIQLYAKACRLGNEIACVEQAILADEPAPAAAAPSKPAASPPAAAAAEPAAGACKLVRVRLGIDTVASVERDIQARGGTPNAGSSARGKHALSAIDGDYADAGPAVMAVNYDFDAADPAGKLIAVTVSRKTGFGAPYAKLAADRKAFLSNAFGGLQPKSATESTGARFNCTLTLYENPDTGWLYELYQLAK